MLFWRHPFTAEDPLVSKLRNAKFLQLFCSTVKETNSSTSWMAWGWVHFLQVFILGFILVFLIKILIVIWCILNDYSRKVIQSLIIIIITAARVNFRWTVEWVTCHILMEVLKRQGFVFRRSRAKYWSDTKRKCQINAMSWQPLRRLILFRVSCLTDFQ